MSRRRFHADNAAKQDAYRQAKKLGMTCAEYRAHIAAGGKSAPETVGNNGQDLIWAARACKASMEGSTTACHGCGYRVCACARIAELRAAGVVTFGGIRRKTHVPSTSGKHVAGVTACGKFCDQVQMVTGVEQVPTCAKCRTIPPVAPEEAKRRQFRKELAAEKQSIMEAIYKPRETTCTKKSI